MNNLHLSRVFHVVSISVLIESIFVLFCIPVALFYQEREVVSLIVSFCILFFSSLLVFLITRRGEMEMSVKDNYFSVVLTWFCISFFGAVPYLLSNTIPHFSNAFFESVSGFTTTGSSILSDIEAMPKSLLFWRAETHWLGGMGVIVLVIALLPYFRIGGQQMIMAEGGFFANEKIKSRTIDVAKRMWLIYVLLTFSEVVALKIAGMSLFDSVCHAFATIATGGFSTKNDSLMGQSASIQYIVIIFMVLSGMNFTLHYLFVHGRFKKVFKNEELRAFLILILLSSIVIAISIKPGTTLSWEKSFRDSLFQVSSLITATGFVSSDYLLWGAGVKMILLLVMLTGACAGSTGGGVKVARYVLVFKSMKQRMQKMISQNVVCPPRFNGNSVSPDIITGITSFITIYYLTIVIGTGVMMLCQLDFVSATSSVITTLGGIGPGFNAVGPVENFSALPELGKFYLSFNMILGRLEILTVLVVFLPSFYRK